MKTSASYLNFLRQMGTKTSLAAIILSSLMACSTEQQLTDVQETSNSADEEELGVIAGSTASADVAKVTVGLDLGGSLCTGTIISKKYVLTASHCVADAKGPRRMQNWKVVFGRDMSSRTRVTRNVVRVINDNTRFVDASSNQAPDIAILEFSGGRPAGFGRAYLPVCSENCDIDFLFRATYNFTRPQSLIIAGYGKSNAHDPRTVGKLLQGQSKLPQDFRKLQNDPRKILPLEPVRGTSLCQGDSGGPTFYRTPEPHFNHIPKNGLVLVGVTSFGDTNCAQYSAITDVSRMINWIDSKVGIRNIHDDK